MLSLVRERCCYAELAITRRASPASRASTPDPARPAGPTGLRGGQPAACRLQPESLQGVGLPFGVGAKVAKPDKQVIVVHGDGSLGLNVMELDTAIRHKIPILVVVSLNGGWTGDPKREKPGRDLGYTRYDKICEALGGYGEYIKTLKR